MMTSAFAAPLLAALLAAAPQPASQSRAALVTSEEPILLTRSPSCTAGTRADDGSFEGAYSFPGLGQTEVAMRLDLDQSPASLDQLCVCFTRTGTATTADFDLLVYAADGPGASPNTLLTGRGGLRATGIPRFPQTAFYNIDLSSLGIDISQDRIYLSAAWNPDNDVDVHLCGDENSAIPRPVYLSSDLGSSWTDVANQAPDLKALGLRADLGDDSGGGGFDCVEDAETLCLNEGRFQVKIDWERPNGVTGTGKVVETDADDSGLFYFFEADNWEMLIKVLDGCQATSHYWVFFAATTNVAYEVTVTDSENGTFKTYTNPQGRRAPAVTDTRALATCR